MNLKHNWKWKLAVVAIAVVAITALAFDYDDALMNLFDERITALEQAEQIRQDDLVEKQTAEIEKAEAAAEARDMHEEVLGSVEYTEFVEECSDALSGIADLPLRPHGLEPDFDDLNKAYNDAKDAFNILQAECHERHSGLIDAGLNWNHFSW